MDKRTYKELIGVLETNDKTISYILDRIQLYTGEIEKAVRANLDIHMELFYRRQPSDRPKK